MMRPFCLLGIIALGAIDVLAGGPSSGQRTTRQASPAVELQQARALNQQMEELYGKGKYREATEPAERALALREKVLEPSHPDIAESLNNLGELRRVQGEYVESESLNIHALRIRETALGADHPDVAQSLNNLGLLYCAQGMYGKAEPLYLRALDIRERVLGRAHPDVAQSLSNLGLLYQAQGSYDRAERLLVRALDIRETSLGNTRSDLAQILNNLAALYQEQGSYDKAEPLYVRTIAILESSWRFDNPILGTIVNNLAEIYRVQGEYGEAELLHTRALRIRQETLGGAHPDVAQSLNNLALLHQARGAYDKAELFFRRALDIRSAAFGHMHPDVAQSLNNLALLYLAKGAHEKAAPLLAEALEIYETVLGKLHPSVAKTLNNYARLLRAQGAYSEALPLLARAAEIRERQLRTVLVSLSEPRRRALMTLLQHETYRVVALHADAMPSSRSALELAFTTILQRKGRILDSLVDGESRRRVHAADHPRDPLAAIFAASSGLAARLAAPATRLAAPATQAGAWALHAGAAARARPEAAPAPGAADADRRTDAEAVTLADLQAALSAGTALVEFVRYQRVDAPPALRHEERYLAYLLTARGAPRWVPLGDATQVDAEIDAALATLRERASIRNARAALRRLDALLLAPIRERIPEVSHLILAPDSKLNLLPFEALVDPEGHYAVENYLVSYVTSGRDLLRLAVPQIPRSPGVIVAAPEYGPLPSPGSPEASFAPLPGALAEASDLRAYFAGAPLTGNAATKSALAARRGPAIVHIATHGYFMAGMTSRSDRPGRRRSAEPAALRGMFMEDTGLPRRALSRTDELADALDLSGLALAGANQGSSGIVTAREIAGFDWWGTQMVVLSACETGVGAASSGEGVYGMRRALVLAGTASQVVSLWGADDLVTRALMRSFYDHLVHGMGRAEALRQTKLHLLRQPQYKHPYYWAAFIVAGDWRPLPRSAFATGDRESTGLPPGR